MPYDHPKTRSADTPDAPSSPAQADRPATAWQAALRPGDVVSFRFPLAEADAGARTPKARPCLVLELRELGGRPFALLAYGTSSRSGANTGYEIPLLGRAAYEAAGLHEPTRFVGARHLLVSLANSGFVACAAAGSPVLGHLPARALGRMARVRARLAAERDLAAERRREAHERRMARVEVVRRRPRRPALPVWRSAS